MDREFEYGGRRFKLSKVNPFKQFHIVRRVSPILSDLLVIAPQIEKLSKKDSTEDDKTKMLSEVAGPIMKGLSKLTDADADYVLYGLLNAVEVEHSGVFSKVAQGENLMMQDLELPTLINIAGKAFMFNLQNFFAVLPAKK